MRGKSIVLVLIVVVAVLTTSAFADSGQRDTVLVEPTTLQVGVSRPITVSVTNDHEIYVMNVPLILTALDSGFATLDSIVYMGRLSDPRVLNYRATSTVHVDGNSPDSTCVYATAGPDAIPLPVGSGPLWEFWLTGNSAGTLEVDSGFVLPGLRFVFGEWPPGSPEYIPEFRTHTSTIVDGPLPPTVDLDPGVVRDAFGQTMTANVAASSPEGFPTSLSLVAFGPVEATGATPSSQPVLAGSGPWTVSWTPGVTDVGLWKATVQACDTAGACSQATIEFQVVESDTYLVDFDLSETTGGFQVSAFAHGNLDEDPVPELFGAGSGVLSYTCMDVYDYTESGWERANMYIPPGYFKPHHSPRFGYIDDDAHLDCMVVNRGNDGCIQTLLGDGEGSFDFYACTQDWVAAYDAVLNEFTDDQYLDYVVVGASSFYVYPGTIYKSVAAPWIYNVGSPARNVQAADFDNDGDNDLAIGTEANIQIWHNDGSGGFSLHETHTLDYGSADIEVTNQGSDFNNDNEFDLCLASPRAGGSDSDVRLFLGTQTGFDPQLIRSLAGAVVSTCVGDFNGDTELDIAYVNGSHDYIGLLFGDGDGTFTNEVRFSVYEVQPDRIHCFDADLDGDLDIVVNAQGDGDHTKDYRVLYYENQLDPEGMLSSSLNLVCVDNADVEIVSPTNRVLNSIRNSIPSGSYLPRDINGNTIVDAQASIGTLESGVYELNVSPSAGATKSSTFSVEFDLNGQQFCIARDALSGGQGFSFEIYPSGGCPVSPMPGGTAYQLEPVFNWPDEATSYDIEVATDIHFTNVIFSTTVSVSTAQGPILDSSYAANPYYWRVKPSEQPEYDKVYPFTVALVGCVNRGDVNHDGSVADIADVVYLVNFMFLNGPPPPNAEEADINADGQDADIADLVRLVDYMFNEGAPLAPCN